MKKTLLMTTAAGMALLAGTAQAADIQPVVVPMVVAPVVVPGPVYRVEINADVTVGSGGGLGTGLSTAVDVRSASGFGFKVETIGGLYFDSPAPVEAEIGILGRIYHTIGTHGTAGVFLSWDSAGLLVGFDADLDRDTLTLNYSLAASIDSGVYEGLQSILVTEIERSRFVFKNLTAGIVPAASSPVFITLSEFGYRIGPVTPYVQVAAGYVGGGLNASAAVGVDLELPIGDGPLTLTGGVLVGFGGMGIGWEATAGLEFNPNDGPLTISAEIGADDAGWGARIGIGVEFGAGRITGFGARVLEDFVL